MGFTAAQMAQVSLVSQIGGMASSGIGAFYGAKSQQAALAGQAGILDANASLAKTQAKMAEAAAYYALDQGQKRVGAVTMKYGQVKGAQRARLAANGVDLGDGSAAELQASADLMKEVDALTISADATRESLRYKAQGIAAESQATAYGAEATMRRGAGEGISPFGALASTIVGSAGTVASSWYEMDKKGLLKGSMFQLSKG